MARDGTNPLYISRRRLLTGAGAFGGTVLGSRLPAGFAAPGVVVSDRERPQIPFGVMSGDPTGGRAIIWSKTDRPARMLVEYATREDFHDAQRVAGPTALAVSDYTARVDLGQLPGGAQIFYRVTFQDLADLKTSSAPAVGSLRTPGEGKRTITFAYSGDEAGQGWGINPEWGGYRLYEAMRGHAPDFFIHSGDQIYADNPFVAEVKTDDGKVWKNLTTEGKSKVAETLDEYRAAFAYNLLDENKRRFAALSLIRGRPGDPIKSDAYIRNSNPLIAHKWVRGNILGNITQVRNSLRASFKRGGGLRQSAASADAHVATGRPSPRRPCTPSATISDSSKASSPECRREWSLSQG